MGSKERSTVIVGNWKMHKTIDETVEFIKQLMPRIKESTAKIYLAVPFTVISAAADEAKGSNIVIGAQNMNDATEGAFTGEIAGKMVVDAGAKFVILGHSERRRYFNETDEFINRKVKRALADGLEAILCIGETAEEREADETENVLKKQLTTGLEGISKEQAVKVSVAYEPVWAIGTSKIATPEIAQEAHAFIRKMLSEIWDSEIADRIVIQYGGSVKPEYVKELIEKPDIDGFLVGGASLSLESFVAIVNNSV